MQRLHRRHLFALAVVVACAAVVYAFTSSPTSVGDAIVPSRLVEVRSVADLSAQSEPLSLTGLVSSKSEAQVNAESGGQVKAVYRDLGDAVSAGTIVAELDSAAQRAALAQAEASQAASQAALDKIKKGTRSEQLAILDSALAGAKDGAVNGLLSAYTFVDGAVRSTSDTFYSQPTSNAPRFNVLVSNSALKIEAENERVLLRSLLERQQERAARVSVQDDLVSELDTTASELRRVRDFLDLEIQALNAGIPTTDYSAATIATYITSASTARTGINSALASVASAKQALLTAMSNQEQGVAGALPEDVSAAEASLAQAKASVAAARANLEKALIRAPISGTINSFSLEKGSYVSIGTPVLTVANNGALEVLAYATEKDAREISVGQRVALGADVSGVVTRVAPAIDPSTKKIEVRIGITGGASSLINGQSVLAQITRVSRDVAAGGRITIPISAIKIETDRVSVFTVEPDMSLKSHTVELGALLGDRVEVAAGLTGDMQIVTDARGLREGQTVEVQ